MMKRVLAFTFVLVLLAMYLGVAPVFAYVGPGAGLNFVWALIGLVGAVLLSIGVIFYIPFKMLFKMIHNRRKAAQQTVTSEVE